MLPPNSLISRVLQKVQVDQVKGGVIVPLWPVQHWYTKLLHMITAAPRLCIAKEANPL